MSAKRRPGTDLNHDNWDEEQELEEVGEFRKASVDELKQRTFKVAKRRIRGAGGPGGDGDDADGDASAAPTAASAFSGFGGFGKVSDGKPASSPFSFLSSSTAAPPATASPFGTLSSSLSGGGVGGNGGGSNSTASGASNGTSTTNSSSTASSSTAATGASKDPNYYAKLKGLNQSVSAWIAKHIAENPVCVLTPIFDDYARHLQDIERSKSTAATEATSTATARPAEPIKTPDFTFKSAASAVGSNSATKETTATSAFSFGSAAALKPTETTAATASTASTFSFGKSTEPAKSTFSFGSAKPAASDAAVASKPATSTFSFGSAAASGGAPSGFSFGGAASQPFTFANIKTPADHAAERAAGGGAPEAEEENEEPPKNEFTPVVEDDSLYTQRCKVFVKTGAEYVDRGVGQLFIKSAADGAKTQLLVRADTNLGNVVLNILLTDAVPASRMGKNNVMMICVPTPDAKPPPVTVLVRVKNAEEADELLAQINKHKK